jgi:Fe-S-cluster containining protein
MAEDHEPSLADVYARIPPVPCKGLCQDSCGPIAMSEEEDERLRARGVTVPSMVSTVAAMEAGAEYWCPALRDGACTVYDVRPTICRLWGATRSMPCPHGCTTDDALTQEQSHELLQAAAKAGGGMVARFFEEAGAARPVGRHLFRRRRDQPGA